METFDRGAVVQALDVVQLSHRRVSALGVNQEESLLQETASREADLLRTIAELEAELRSVRCHTAPHP